MNSYGEEVGGKEWEFDYGSAGGEQDATRTDQPGPGPTKPPVPEVEVRTLVTIIKAFTGHDYSSSPAELIARAAWQRMQDQGITSVETYLAFLVRNPEEVEVLGGSLKTVMCEFFRDQEAFEVLRYRVLPDLFATLEPETPLRIWDVGCESGAEAFSVAMVVCDYLDVHQLTIDVKIFATDHDREKVSEAKSGLFTDEELGDLDQERRKKYFHQVDNGWQVGKRLQQMIIFTHHHLLQDPPFSKLDLIVCRDLFFTLDVEIKQSVLSLFHIILKPGGVLFLGSLEEVPYDAPLFEPINSRWRLYRRRQVVQESPVFPPIRCLSPWTVWTNFLPSTTASKDWKKRVHPLKMAEQYLVEHYAPASVIVTDRCEVRHFLSSVQRYLHLETGEPTMDLVKMLRSELKSVVMAAIGKVFDEHRQVTVRRVKVVVEGQLDEVNVLVTPLGDGTSYRRLALVVLESVTGGTAKTAQGEGGGHGRLRSGGKRGGPPPRSAFTAGPGTAADHP